MLAPIFRNAKIGDKVIASGCGRGTIIRIDESNNITVDFETHDYPVDEYGRLFDYDVTPTCFPIGQAPQELLDMFPENVSFEMEVQE